MNIHELVDMFYHKLNGPDDATAEDSMRVVVRALRDETRHMTLNRDSLEELFTQILGDAGEKVAEGIAERADEQRADAPATDPIRDAVAMARGRALVVDDIPILNKLAAAMKAATDAAPAVCEWTGEEYVTYSTSCESEHEVDPHKAPPTHCPSCGKPIAFTEANHG